MPIGGYPVAVYGCLAEGVVFCWAAACFSAASMALRNSSTAGTSWECRPFLWIQRQPAGASVGSLSVLPSKTWNESSTFPISACGRAVLPPSRLGSCAPAVLGGGVPCCTPMASLPSVWLAEPTRLFCRGSLMVAPASLPEPLRTTMTRSASTAPITVWKRPHFSSAVSTSCCAVWRSEEHTSELQSRGHLMTATVRARRKYYGRTGLSLFANAGVRTRQATATRTNFETGFTGMGSASSAGRDIDIDIGMTKANHGRHRENERPQRYYARAVRAICGSWVRCQHPAAGRSRQSAALIRF